MNTIGKGPLAFVLAYGWGILLFVALASTLGLGIYWIVITTYEKARKETGGARWKFLAWTAAIVFVIGLAMVGLTINLGPSK